MRRANEFIFNNRMLNAEEAAEWGLVSRVVEDDRLMAEAHEAAAQLANGPQQAYGRIKHLLNSSLSASFEAQMQLRPVILPAQLKPRMARRGYSPS